MTAGWKITSKKAKIRHILIFFIKNVYFDWDNMGLPKIELLENS